MISEINTSDLGIAAKVSRRPGGKHFAVLDDVGAMSYAQGLAHLVVGDQDADSLTAQIADDLLDTHDGQGSIPEKGSSSRMKAGSSTSDRAISRRRRSPPDNVYAPLYRTVSSFICANNSSSRSRCCAAVSGKVSSTANKFSSTDSWRNTEGSCGK